MFRISRFTKSLLGTFIVLLVNSKVYAYTDGGGINYISYFGNLLLFLIIFIAIVLLALYFTKFIAKRTNYLGKGKNLRVLDFVNLNGSVKIITVKIYKKVYILSVSNNHTTLIDKLDEEEMDRDFEDYLNENLNRDQKDFAEYIDVFKEKIVKKIKDRQNDGE